MKRGVGGREDATQQPALGCLTYACPAACPGGSGKGHKWLEFCASETWSQKGHPQQSSPHVFHHLW
eukprot:4185573-Amphidinium_carterae.1